MWNVRKSGLQLTAWPEYDRVLNCLAGLSPRLESIAASMLADLESYSTPSYYVK